jgi:signal transduction histidine kinase
MMDVSNFAYDVAASVESKIKAAGVKLDCDFDTEQGEVQMDAGVMRLALINILENALDACIEDTAKKSHKIVFSVKPDGEQIVFEIRDDGTGMDRETRESLFTLFFSSKGNKGTGLGLFIANKIIEQHGGKIKLDSKPNRGTNFRITIPNIQAKNVI